MKQIIYNEEKLTDKEVDRMVNKVRGIVINKNGQVMLCRNAGIYLLPGGSVERNESLVDGLKREIFEEGGEMEIDEERTTPFLQIKSYNRNYYDRKLKRYTNRLTVTSFFETYTECEIKPEKLHLTESEKAKKFMPFFTNLSSVDYIVSTNTTTDNEKKEVFDREIRTVLREYAEFKKKSKNLEDDDNSER